MRRDKQLTSLLLYLVEFFQNAKEIIQKQNRVIYFEQINSAYLIQFAEGSYVKFYKCGFDIESAIRVQKHERVFLNR